jgi:hypothetical protein
LTRGLSSSVSLDECWKDQNVFFNSSSAEDLEMILANSLIELPRISLVVDLNFRSTTSGAFAAIPHDADAFQENHEAAAF